MSPKKKALLTSNILKNFYGEPQPWKSETSLDALVAVILSQNTSDKNSFPAFHNLKKTFPKWEQVIVADEKKIAAAIRKGGLANIKAKRIKEVLKEIKRRTGKLDISFLAAMSIENAREFLLSLKGVGPKSAAVVLNFAFWQSCVSKRLGLIEEKISAEKAHEVMGELVSDSDKQSYHLNLIRLGREICVARKPRCEKCPLKKHCKYYKEVFSKQR